MNVKSGCETIYNRPGGVYGSEKKAEPYTICRHEKPEVKSKILLNTRQLGSRHIVKIEYTALKIRLNTRQAW